MASNPILRKIKYALRYLPDDIYIQLYYFSHFKHFANLKNPKTYNEKLNWLKLNDRKELYTKLVDKYEVKKYVANLIGEEYIIPTLGVWEKFDDIDFDVLPDKFVLKCTHDSEGLVIVRDKKNFDKKAAKEKIENALKLNFYYIGREWPYKNIKPQIIAEKYMEDKIDGELRDYKFFCFSGKAKVMFVASDRNKDNTKFDFYDMDFNHLCIKQHYPNAGNVRKPITFNKMIELSEILASGLPHVRVDFYEVDGKCYFGEMTFYHFSGFMPFKPNKWDEILGDWLKLPDKSGDSI